MCQYMVVKWEKNSYLSIMKRDGIRHLRVEKNSPIVSSQPRYLEPL